MGIRINKVVGWGTDSLELKDPEGFDEKCEALYDLSAKEWLAWITVHEEEIYAIANHLVETQGRTLPCFTPKWMRALVNNPGELKLARPGRCYAFDDEFGLENAIVFWPFNMHHKCCRYNDLIDWFEESMYLSKTDETVRFVPYDRGIHPFEKGQIPFSVIATCIFLGVEDVVPKLKEVLYVYWS